jgi:putative RNA 2'-phosphotransferase
MSNLVRLSKFLALILRHKADEFAIELDEEGFADLNTVFAVIENRYKGQYSFEDLLTVVEGDSNKKKRYEIVGSRIRAMFGHGAVRSVHYQPAIPPDYLYHGTTPQSLPIIKQEGLKSLSRQYVHLTTNLDNARNVALRRTKESIILTINALDAYQDGIIFYNPESEHYLTQAMPPVYIQFPEDE